MVQKRLQQLHSNVFSGCLSESFSSYSGVKLQLQVDPAYKKRSTAIRD